VCTVTSYKGDSAQEFSKQAEIVKSMLEKYHKLFDIYNEYDGINNIKTINDNAGIAPVKVTPELLEFIKYSKEMYTLTSGSLNIALGSVLTIWHNYRTEALELPQNAKVPSVSSLESAAQHTNINDLIIDEENSTVYIKDPQMSLNVGAIGKGYATQKIADKLIADGVSSYVLNMGGNIRVIGTKVDGNGWVTGITNPNRKSTDRYAAKIILKDVSLVTSGDYERYYTVNGVNYHHIIDPDTLQPARYFSSVSILTKDSALADALSTALFCMSYEDGLKLINTIGSVEVMWITTDFTILKTPGFELYSGTGK
jgi:thiamine biosynthesis lipoprotein